MELFKLPHTTKVMKVVPKNHFDSYTTSKQKKLFTDWVSRITWQNKIARDTTNLETKTISEILVFNVELKEKQDIQILLNIIEKAVPYTIVFIVEYLGSVYLSTSVKHPHPIAADNAVIDWTFKTDWFVAEENKYQLNLFNNIDAVYQDFCIQLMEGNDLKKKSLEELVHYSKEKESLEKEIMQLQKSIKSCQQFKLKVELNLALKQKMDALQRVTES